MSDEKNVCLGGLPKGQWSCPRCGQSFCTPVSCFDKLRQQKQSTVASKAPKKQGGQVMSQAQGADVNQSSEEKKEVAPGNNQVEPELDFCQECGSNNGHHPYCSYHVAHII